ncbi:MAG TPA: molybdenum cofactor biosynthesis protein MoaE, partial [Alphaproteobacteria bacterium]|nr:molybdenum cofactor biosynthesis protein MoaE [Alphaproteobacteria bacterium]
MDRPAISVCVTHRPIDLSAAQAFLSDPAHGAMDLFIGTVRDNHQGKAVTGITYDVHVPLAEKILEEICARARTLWPGTRYYVAHFQGDLKVGEISILIGVGAAHRAEAFEACRFVIEEIKTRAPVWKREHYPDRDSAWLPGHALVGGARPCVA